MEKKRIFRKKDSFYVYNKMLIQQTDSKYKAKIYYNNTKLIDTLLYLTMLRYNIHVIQTE